MEGGRPLRLLWYCRSIFAAPVPIAKHVTGSWHSGICVCFTERQQSILRYE